MKHKDSATKDTSPSRRSPLRRAFALTMLLAYLSSLSPAFCLDSKKPCQFPAQISACTESPGSAGRFSSVFFYYIHISVKAFCYPDGETVDYGYDAGGQVERVTGHHYGHDYLFVLDIGYDELGQRSYISYGNGVRTDYDYDPDRRWLSSIETRRDGRQYQNISYSFDRVGNVLGYKNDCMDGLRYSVSQTYGYDALYQLTSAHGETTNDPFKGGIPDYRSTYDQSYSFDVIGNMTRKTSGSSVYPQKAIGSYLDYDFDYGYAAGFAHRLDHAGGRYYRYDLDGNITMEHHGPIPEGLPGGGSGSTGGGSGSGGDDDFWDDPAGNGQYNGSWDGDMAGDGTGSDDDFWDDWDEDSEYSGSWTGNSGSGSGSDDDFWDDMDENAQYTGSWDGDMADDGTGSDDGFWDDLGGNGQYNGSWDGEMAGGSGTGAQQDSSILAVYEWDERDRLVRSQTPDVTAYYVYGEDGQRTNKHTSDSETLYFSRLWTWHDGKGAGDQTSKHIYLGSERIVTQMNGWKGQQTYSEELNKTYYYHPDHLGSAQLITDNKGQEYQRIEYTPYGELWVDKIEDPLYVYMPYKFTGKELDEETGLYYYGARYMDPMYSVWISPDPALGDYIPTAGADNSSLPGMGGVFNTTNCHLYHYAGNNPVKYVDPDGREIFSLGNNLYGDKIELSKVKMDFIWNKIEFPKTGNDFTDGLLKSLLGIAKLYFSEKMLEGSILAGSAIAVASDGTLLPLGLTVGGTGCAFATSIAVEGIEDIYEGLNLMARAGKGEYRHRDGQAKRNESKMIDRVASKKGIDSHKFGKYVEEMKALEGKSNSQNYTWKDLEEYADMYIQEIGE